MTEFTVHPDDLFQPNRPILGSTQIEARDNLAATAEGSAGAPIVRVAALGQYSAGDVRRFFDAATVSNGSSNYLPLYGGSFWGYGSFRLKFDYIATSSNLLVQVSGVTVLTPGGETDFTAFTGDIDIAEGDYFAIVGRTIGATTTRVQNIEFLTDGEQLLPYGSDLNGWIMA